VRRAAPSSTQLAAPFLIAAFVLAGCAGGRAVGVQAAPPPELDEVEPEAGGESAAHELEATVLEIYSHLTLGNFAAYRDALAGETPVVLLGLTPGDVVVGLRPRAAGRDRRLYRATAPTVLSKNLEIHLSDDASVGWTFDEMSYRVPYGGRIAAIPVRNTSLFVRDIDRWVLIVEHQSYPSSIDDLRADAAAGRAAQPGRFPSLPVEGTARELVRLVGLLHNAEPRDLGRRVAPGGDTLVLLPDRDHELHGAEAVDGPSLATLFGPNTTVGLRDYRIGMAKNESVAWMAANLVVRTVVNDEQVDLGLRGTYVFRKAARGWELVQMHISAPLSEMALSRRVFGAP
jgi:ketosteroid isomerase-like protein